MAVGRGRSPALTHRRRRRGRGWTAPRKPLPEPAPPNDGEPPHLLPPGAEVEVRVDGEGFYGSWYKAKIVDYALRPRPPLPGHYIVTYDDLLDNSLRVLEEQIAPTHVRPRPPVSESPPRSFRPHEFVEAFHCDGWWSGIVVSAAPAASVTVAFPITREVIPFEEPHLVRPRRDYIGGEWVPSPAVITVRSKGGARVYVEGEEVEVVRDRELYGRSWFLATVVKVIDDLSYIVRYSDPEGGAAKVEEYSYLHWQIIRPAVNKVEDLPLEVFFFDILTLDTNEF